MDIDAVRSAAMPRALLFGRAVHLAAGVIGHLVVTTARAVGAGAVRPSAVAAFHRRRLPDLLTGLGPSFMKVGQLLSTRRDLLSAATCDALGRLVADVPAPGPAQVAAVLAHAYGPAGRQPFAEFDPVPVASGTIASVHRAVLRDGRTVAVKVRRGGIARTMTADLALLTATARWCGALPGLRRVPLGEMAGQVARAVHGQLDFVAERAALQQLADNFAARDAVVVPLPVTQWCTPETVVMEYVPDLRAYRPAAMAPEQRREMARHTLESVYLMLFRDGLVHCDLHPGNLYLKAGSVVILDAGFVVRLPDRVRRLFAAFFLNMALGRGLRCADIVIESAASVRPDCDLDGFRRDLAELVHATQGRPAQEFSLGRFAAQLFALQRRHGLYAAAEFVFPLLSLLVIEGMINEFDPGVDFQAIALPILMDSLYAG